MPPPPANPAPSLQMGDEKKPQRIALGEAVSKGIIANETLAYFIGRTYLFAQRVGAGTRSHMLGVLRTEARAGACCGCTCHGMLRAGCAFRATLFPTRRPSPAAPLLPCRLGSTPTSCASGSTCSTRWRTTQRTAGTSRWGRWAGLGPSMGLGPHQQELLLSAS